MRKWFFRAFSWIPRWILVTICTGVILVYCGSFMNQFTVRENGGRMPVAMQASEILFVIGRPSLGTEYFLPEYVFSESKTHQPIRPDTKYLLLTDRIPIESLTDTPRDLPPMLVLYFERVMHLNYQEDAIASIGDLVLWAGTLMWSLGYVLLVVTAIKLFYKQWLRRLTS